MEHIVKSFLEVVKKHGNKPAVSDEKSTFTYKELYDYAITVAANLQAEGVKPESRVIVEIPRSKEYAACLLGCWMAGVAAIPLSDDYPEERLNYIKNDSGYDLSIDEVFIKNMDMSLVTEPVITELGSDGVIIYTSGSTGNPKGVIHDFYSMGAVAARNAVHDQSDETERNNISGLIAPFTFVVGTGLFLAAVTLGKHLYIVPDEIRKDPFKLAAYYDENNIESSFVPPRMVDFMLKHNKSLKSISVGSERITNIFFDDKPVVMNGYGSTELFGGTLAFKIDKSYENTPIGKPFGSEKAYVLDEKNNETEIGELCISGYVAKGYLNRPAETKKAFIKNPFKDRDGFDRMFRTGDIVQRLPDGNLVFIERKDWMIKINGQRVEPLEVESNIRRLPGIKEAAVKDFTSENGVTFLAAYYVCDENITEETVKNHCKANLTSYMVPSFCIRMDSLPLNPNGKLDRKNLPKPDISAFKGEYAPPENKIEAALCSAFEEILKCGKIGRNDDFFQLGGDSVKAVEVINALSDLPLDIETFFKGKTPAKTASLIESGGNDEIPFDRSEKAAYPLTSSQLGVYFAVESDPDTLMYNNPVKISLGKNVDTEKFSLAVEKAVKNHGAYSCRIDIYEGYPSMIPCENDFKVEHKKADDLQKALDGFLKTFDIKNGELVRACIFESDSENVFAFDAHHIVFDGTTLSVLLKEIQRAYEGLDIFEEKTSAFHLSGYEKALIASEKYTKAKEYYEKRFDGLEISNDFPLDYEDTGKMSLDSVDISFTDTDGRLLKLLKSNAVTENSLFLAAYSFVLAKFNGTDKALVCIAESGRHTSMTFNTAGMLVKTIPLPVELSRYSDISEYILDLQRAFRDSTENDSYPFGEIAGKYGINNDFMFVYQSDAFSSLTLDGESYAVIGMSNPHAINKLTLMAFRSSDGYRFSFRYRSDIFSKAVIESFSRAFVNTVREFTQKEYLKDAELVSAQDEKLLDSFAGETVPVSDKTVTELFGEWVKKTPEHDLTVYSGKHYTYGEAGQITDSIAEYIINLGLGRNDVVSVLVQRSEWIVLATYGVLKAGCAYEPLDHTYPSERLSFMVKNAGAKLLIADRELCSLLRDYDGAVLYTDDIINLPASGEVYVKNEKDDLLVLLYTSGTTGTPKGVMLTHGNILNIIETNKEKYGIDESSVDACYASYGFDACMCDLMTFPTLGGTVHIIPEEMRLDLPEVNRYYTDNKISHSIITTQVGRQFALMTSSPYLKHLLVGGEALVPLDTDNLSFRLYNGYGPSECTVYVSAQRVSGHYYRVPIGKLNPNCRGYVVDGNMKRLPAGAPGELLISGSQVGKGYLDLPEKTASVFIDNPFSREKGYEKAYRTGDIVRFLPDGSLDFIGRSDGQVKIRGFRIELTEVEEIIRRFDGIKDATVAAFNDPSGGKYIAAYVVSDDTVDVDALNTFILSEKPPYMVPSVTVQIDKIPLNQNQKVNRRALPEPKRRAALIVPPTTETQKTVCGILSRVLGHSAFGIDTDVYEAGLTSIGVISLNAELEKSFGIPFKVADIKAHGTVRLIEELILSSEKEEKYDILPDYPITKTQMGIYIECSSNPLSTDYNIPLLIKLSEKINTERLVTAIKNAVNAHPYLKTTLFADSEGNIKASRNDGLEPIVKTVKSEKAPTAKEAVKPFELIGCPLYRITVYETQDGNFLFMDFHHIISDGTSENILLSDISREYSGESAVKESYTGFEAALDEEKARKTEIYANAVAYYDSIFKGCEPCCLPPKAPEKKEPCAASVVRTAGTDHASVESYCKKNKVTQNAFFNAAFGYTLSKFGQFDDVVYTTIYNGRSDSRLQSSVTMLVKTLPVLIRTGGSCNVSQLIHDTQNQLINSMTNDIFSFAEISASYGIHSDIIFAYQGDDFIFDTVCGEKAELIKIMPDNAKAPIVLNVYLKNGKYELIADYRRDMYRKELIDSLLDIFDLVMKGFTEKEKAEDIALMSERAEKLLTKINSTEREFENLPANSFVERYARLYPERPAVICDGISLTYGELNRMANTMAHRLISLGVKKDTVVAMMLPRTHELSLTELAILKSGGAFLGLLPDYPDERIDFCLTDAQCPVIITTEEIKDSRGELFSDDKPYKAFTVKELLEAENHENPDLHISPDSLAYCIYTSGSTGKPKGVMIEHHNLCNVAQPKGTVYDCYHGDKGGKISLALSSVSFDASILDNLLFLMNGKTVCIATERQVHNPAELAGVIKENGVDTMMSTPSLLTNLLSIPEFHPAMENINTIFVGAEAFPAPLYDVLKELSPNINVINGYGPSECTITCCAKKLEGNTGITIGGPTANTKIYIADTFGNILPPYACGELIICGELVGRGYMNLPEKTKAAFFTLRGLPAYHSGDIVRINSAGEVEFFGRRDNQVKLRGFRVELDEIEKCMGAFEGITASKVVVRNNGAEDYLAGFYTADRKIDTDELTSHMKSRLAYYMVPDVMLQLDAMPLTPSGKIDKKALPEVKRERKKSGRKAPKKSTEQELCELFASVLSLDEFYADDNFFEMGGTSLSASKVTMQLMAKGIKVEHQNIFDNPTPEMLSDYIDGLNRITGTQKYGDENSEIQSDYPEQLQYNTLSNASQVKREPLGDVLLTGAVGFLGIHVLKELIDRNEGDIICLVRRGSFSSSLSRLKSMLIYYFDSPFSDVLGKRVKVVEADITDELTSVLHGERFDTIINCAACVKHYASDDILEKINVHGVENLIELANEKNARLIQVSTISIPGAHTEETYKKRVKMYENKLFVIDDMGNKYGISKYHAELKMLEAIKNGMRGKIIRVGNLMGRHSDGEFQINFNTNAFLNAFRGFAAIGKCPVSHSTDPMSFSPIDMTAKAVVLLSGTNDIFTAFNADSRFIFDEWQLIEAANRCGITINPVPDEEYYADYHRMLGDPSVNSRLQGLMTNDRPDIHGVESDNTFTANVLYRLGFSWPLPDTNYLERAIESLLTLDYFEPDEE